MKWIIIPEIFQVCSWCIGTHYWYCHGQRLPSTIAEDLLTALWDHLTLREKKNSSSRKVTESLTSSQRSSLTPYMAGIWYCLRHNFRFIKEPWLCSISQPCLMFVKFSKKFFPYFGRHIFSRQFNEVQYLFLWRGFYIVFVLSGVVYTDMTCITQT